MLACLSLEHLHVDDLIWASFKRYTLLKCPILLINDSNLSLEPRLWRLDMA